MIDDTNTVVLYYVHSIKAAKLADILWHRSQFSNQAPADVEKTPSWNIQTTSYNLFDYFLYLNFLWFCQRNWNQTSYWIYHKVFYILSPWLVTVGIGKQEGQVSCCGRCLGTSTKARQTLNLLFDSNTNEFRMQVNLFLFILSTNFMLLRIKKVHWFSNRCFARSYILSIARCNDGSSLHRSR